MHSAENDAPGPLTCPTCGEPDPGRLHTHTADNDVPLTQREAVEQMERTRVIIAGWQGLHACVGCGLELDADDRNDRCEDCPIPPVTTQEKK